MMLYNISDNFENSFFCLYFANMNWGKIYENLDACAFGKPCHFCGSKYDDVNICYDCMNYEADKLNIFRKYYILIYLLIKNVYIKIRNLYFDLKVRKTKFDNDLPF